MVRTASSGPCLSDGIEAIKIAERDFDRELRRFARTALIEAERPQRKLFEPKGEFLRLQRSKI